MSWIEPLLLMIYFRFKWLISQIQPQVAETLFCFSPNKFGPSMALILNIYKCNQTSCLFTILARVRRDYQRP